MMWACALHGLRCSCCRGTVAQPFFMPIILSAALRQGCDPVQARARRWSRARWRRAPAARGRQVAFFMRKGADVLSKWVGEAERQLRLLFEARLSALLLWT